MSPFFDALLDQNEIWRHLPFVERSGDGWRGFALTVPPPFESDPAAVLDIEEVDREITISFDHSHIHVEWPSKRTDAVGNVWFDAVAIIDGIVNEEILSLSGWIDCRLRIGSLQKVGEPPQLFLSNIQHLRVRSWRGTFDWDEMLLKNC